MSEAAPKGTPETKSTQVAKIQLPIHFIKSTCFRVVHANGVWYGGDSHGNLHLTFFNERNPIPKTLVLNLDERGIVIGEDQSKRESKQGVVREMEVDIVLSLSEALELYQTLGENLKSVQENQKTADERIKALQQGIKHESIVSR